MTKHQFFSVTPGFSEAEASHAPVGRVLVSDTDGIAHLLCIAAANNHRRHAKRNVHILLRAAHPWLLNTLIPAQVPDEDARPPYEARVHSFFLSFETATAHVERCKARVSRAQLYGTIHPIDCEKLEAELRSAEALAEWVLNQEEPYMHIRFPNSRFQARRLDVAIALRHEKRVQRSTFPRTIPSVEHLPPSSKKKAIPPPPPLPTGSPSSRKQRTFS